MTGSSEAFHIFQPVADGDPGSASRSEAEIVVLECHCATSAFEPLSTCASRSCVLIVG